MILITISPDGLGREQNPYGEYITEGESVRNDLWQKWYEDHPPLPVISPAGEAVKTPGSYEVEMVEQYKDIGEWCYDPRNMSLETRQIYRILPQPKESMEEYAAQFKSQSTHIDHGEKKNIGVENGISPCPLCNSKEGDEVILGYKEPRWMITCCRCNLQIVDDRKDKVQAKWNLRNGTSWWNLKDEYIEKSKVVELMERIKMNMEQTGYDRGVNHACNLLLTELQKL